jgi:hypothetical protein
MIKYKKMVHIICDESFGPGLRQAITSLTVKSECICVYAQCSVHTVDLTAPQTVSVVSRLNSHTVWQLMLIVPISSGEILVYLK